jgi:hypothetical protein
MMPPINKGDRVACESSEEHGIATVKQLRVQAPGKTYQVTWVDMVFDDGYQLIAPLAWCHRAEDTPS